jgi:hypothetical protein
VCGYKKTRSGTRAETGLSGVLAEKQGAGQAPDAPIARFFDRRYVTIRQQSTNVFWRMIV